MVRFIFFCMGLIVFSFIAVPVFTGISNKHDVLLSQETTASISATPSLSFEEIYETARGDNSPAIQSLSAIEPAAGDTEYEYYSSGFGRVEDPALEDFPMEVIE